ncbi:MAG: RND transporter [Rhodobacterales bacterium]|nr:MAG: RND transporter [Rhodobacterales bacterium]
MTRKFRTRWLILIVIAGVFAAALFVVLQPKPVAVDLGVVDRGPMELSIESEGQTRVAQTYIVSAPISGRLERVTIEPGDTVTQGETILARMRPALPAVLDARSLAQAQAALDEAKAALSAAHAERDAANSARALADRTLSRTQSLARSGTVSTAAVDNAEAAADSAAARLSTADAAIAMREAAVARAQTLVDQSLAPDANGSTDFPILSPANGSALRILVESATTLAAGTPIIEVGDVSGDLEVVSDLLSRDAVRVRAGQDVTITNWGGGPPLAAKVLRVSPAGVTKVSALGVEEQRVEVVIGFDGTPADHVGLGHGFQVTAHIVVWRAADTVRLPSAALFRDGDGWAVYVQAGDQAAKRVVQIGVNNGVYAQVDAGIEPGESVVLYPSDAISDGVPLIKR